ARVHGANTLVLFSTAPGRTALDGPPGDNSPFAAAFLRQLEAPATPVDLRALPEALRRDLLTATAGRQVLWDHSTFSAPHLLGPSDRRAPPRDGSGSGAGRPVAAPASPARTLDIPQACAFARDKGLSLPPGL